MDEPCNVLQSECFITADFEILIELINQYCNESPTSRVRVESQTRTRTGVQPGQ